MSLTEQETVLAPTPVPEIQRLVHNLRAELLTQRLEAISHIRDIAFAFGPERTRQEILPFIRETTDDEDEYLIQVAAELGTMADLVGGQEHAAALFSPLLPLACAEEREVREVAVQSITNVLGAVPDTMFRETALPLLRDLAQNQWHTGRMSACTLIAIVFPRLDVASREDLHTWTSDLANDSVPPVRKKLCSHLGDLCAHLEASEISSRLVPILERLGRDEQDSVRCQLVEPIVHLAGALPAALQSGTLMNLTLGLATDESWRVRWSFADRVVELCRVFNPDLAHAAFCASFGRLLTDSEAEVRFSACQNLTQKCELWPRELLVEHILPSCETLASDEADYVRRCAAVHITSLAPAVGREATMQRLVPCTLALLQDADAEVRLNFVSNLRPLHETIGLENLMETLLPAVRNLAAAPHWRTRVEIVNLGPTLAQQIGEQLFNENLIDLALQWLSDDVFAVREAAARNLKEFLSMFGVAWGEANMLPALQQMCRSESYIPRYTACLAAKLCGESPHSVQLSLRLLPQILELVEDPVANIRINVAEALTVLSRANGLQEEQTSRIREGLQRLAGDADADVRHAAT